MEQHFALNSTYKILTDNGWEDFVGVVKNKNSNKSGFRITTSNRQYLECTCDHRIFLNGIMQPAYKAIVGDSLHFNGSPTQIVSIENIFMKDTYDIFRSESNTIRANGFNVHQCDELAFVDRKISWDFWTAVFPALSCLVAGTKVLGEDGFRPIEYYFDDTMQIGDYVEKEIPVWTMRGMQNTSHVYISPESATYKITTESGYEVEVTENHPLFSITASTGIKGKMVKSKELKAGDLLRCDFGMNIYGKDFIHKAQAYKDGLEGKGIERLYTWSLGCIRQFLGGFFDSGRVTVEDELITLWTLSKEEVMCFKLIFANMGIISKIHETGSKYKLVINKAFGNKLLPNINSKNKKWSYELVSDKEHDHIVLNEYIKKDLEREMRNRGKLKQAYEDRMFSRKTLNYSMIEKYRNMGCYIGLDTSVFWDKIEKIERGRAPYTYDFTVPVSHSFLQNGIMGSNTGGKCIITSTPTDDETLFADLWKKANDTLDDHGNEREGGVGRNGFKAFKAKWDRMPTPDRLDGTFKTQSIENFGEEKWLREHELEFIPDLETLISPTFLAEMKESNPMATINNIRWYKRPSKDYMYMVGYDPASGTGGDYSAIQIFEFPSMEQVGEWKHNKTDVSDQVRILKKIMDGFKTSGFDEDKVWWTFENNGVGESVITAIKEMEDQDIEIFGQLVNEKRGRRSSLLPRKGMRTGKDNKRPNCLRMKKWIEQGKLKVRSKATIKELKTYVTTRTSFGAVAGENDDLVMAMLLCVRLAQKAIDDEEEVLGDSNMFNEFSDLVDDDSEGEYFPLPVG